MARMGDMGKRNLGQRAAALREDFPLGKVLPNGLTLADSYHCSRYNTNTGRLTTEMFHDVFEKIRGTLKP